MPSKSPKSDRGHSLGKGLASSKLTYWGGSFQSIQKNACVHMGGTDTIVQVPMMSSTQKPGHMINGRTHRCKHMGTRPMAAGSSYPCGAAHFGNNEEQCILRKAVPHDLYILSLVLPTFRANVAGKPARIPSIMESVTSAPC